MVNLLDRWRDWRAGNLFAKEHRDILSTNSRQIIILSANAWYKRDDMERTPPERVIEVKIRIINRSDQPFPITYNEFEIKDLFGNPVKHYVYASNPIGTVIEPRSTLDASLHLIADFNDIDTIQYCELGFRREEP